MRNLSLATPFMAKSSIISLVVAISLLCGASAIASDPVYKWKDSNGQSHYSQQPPDGVKYETITTVGATTTTAPVVAPAAADAVAAQPAAAPTPGQTTRQKNCDTAQKNVVTFTTKPVVSMDINGSGKPVNLTPEQQAAQLNFAKQQVAAFCSK